MQPRQRRETLSPLRPRLTYSIVRSYPSVSMRRSNFLPLFFTILTIAFVVVLVVRLRSDMREQKIAAAKTPVPPAPTETIAEVPPTVTGSQLPVVGGRAITDKRQPTNAKPEAATTDNRQLATGNRQPATRPQPTATSPPSLLSRVLAPIAKALTPAPAKATPAPKPQPSTQPPSMQSSSGGSSSSS